MIYRAAASTKHDVGIARCFKPQAEVVLILCALPHVFGHWADVVLIFLRALPQRPHSHCLVFWTPGSGGPDF